MKATLLTIVDNEFGNIGCVQVSKKGNDEAGVRYCVTFLEMSGAAKVIIKTDNEPSIIDIVN